MTVDGYRVSFWSGKNVLKNNYGDGCIEYKGSTLLQLSREPPR